MGLEVLPGTAELRDVAHILVPGRGRDATGFGLPEQALARLTVAHQLFDEVAGPAGGRVVCSGYKTPVDHRDGLPEAEMMKAELVRQGVPGESIVAESRSIDTVTNFLRTEIEGFFGDDRPVAIVAQQHHLDRMMTVIAPRTLRRGYVGVVVPEQRPGREGPLVTLVSRIILTGLPDDPEPRIETAERRARHIWRAAELLGKRSYF